jgi:TIR domain
MTIQVFVSYRRGDSPHAAGRLVDRLDEHFELFIDVRIRPGADFTSVVRAAVDESDVLVAVIGLQWLTLAVEGGGRRIDQPGDWVAEEIGTALRRGTLVIPVLVDGAQMPSRTELPPALADLANRQALKITHESFAADSQRLIEMIEEMVSAATPQTVDLWDDPDYPPARAAFLQELWPAAIEGFERVLRRHPRQQQVVEQLEQARRSQHLLDLDAIAASAADAGRWQEVVDTLKAIDALQPTNEVKDRLTQAQLSLRTADLQNDVRALAKTGNWKAVLAADAELGRLDAEAADPDGLATKARAELLETDARPNSVAPARVPAAAWRPSRSTAYLAATAALATLGILLAFFGPDSPVTEELRWDVNSHTTQARADLPEGTVGLSPTLLGLDLPRSPISLDVNANTFDIGTQRLFLAGPAIAELHPSGEQVRLVRSGGAWWLLLLTIPGVVMVLGAVFSFAYGELLLRPVWQRRGTVRTGELVGMAGAGAVLGVAITIAGWIAGNVPAVAGVLGVVLCLAAAAGLLPYAAAALPEDRGVLLVAVPLALLVVLSITWTAVGISGAGQGGPTTAPSSPQTSTKTTTPSTKTTSPPAPPPKWQRGTDLPESLESAGVTAFGDAVWVVGGNAPSAGRPTLDKVWFYKNGWQPGPKLPVRLDSMSVASDGKRLFVVGGQTSDSKGGNKKISRDVWVLDGPDDDSWKLLNRLPEERAGGAVAWDGRRLVFAGGLSRRDLNGDGEAEQVNHADVWVWEGEGQWRKIGKLQRQREDLVAASDGNGRVWFLGGADASKKDGRVPLGAVDLVEGSRITPLSDIDPVRSSSAVWLADRGVCLFGGVTRTVADPKDFGTNKVVCVPGTGSPSPTSRPLPPLTLARAGTGAAVQGGMIWLVGGFGPEQKGGPTQSGLSIVDVLVL